MAKKLLKYQEEFIKWMDNATNIEILNEFNHYQSGDVQSGVRSKQGEWKYQMLRINLMSRLIDFGFMKYDDVIKEV